MIPASILVILDLIVVTGFTLWNIFKNREQDKRLADLERAVTTLDTDTTDIDRRLEKVESPIKPKAQ